METINCLIKVRLRELARSLETMQACVACNVKAKVVGVPHDVSEVAVVVYHPNGSRFTAQPLGCDGNGDWRGKVAGTCFPKDGDAKYELIGTDADGETISLGWGRVIVAKFSSAGETAGGDVVRITAIPDKNGTMHEIFAVQNEFGEWTWEFGG